VRTVTVGAIFLHQCPRCGRRAPGRPRKTGRARFQKPPAYCEHRDEKTLFGTGCPVAEDRVAAMTAQLKRELGKGAA
jgi:hypothetical protein